MMLFCACHLAAYSMGQRAFRLNWMEKPILVEEVTVLNLCIFCVCPLCLHPYLIHTLSQFQALTLFCVSGHLHLPFPDRASPFLGLFSVPKGALSNGPVGSRPLQGVLGVPG